MEPIFAIRSSLYLDGTVLSEEDIQPYVQDSLDELECIMGDVSTPFGKLRASLGHPNPWQINFVGGYSSSQTRFHEWIIDARFRLGMKMTLMGAGTRTTSTDITPLRQQSMLSTPPSPSSSLICSIAPTHVRREISMNTAILILSSRKSMDSIITLQITPRLLVSMPACNRMSRVGDRVGGCLLNRNGKKYKQDHWCKLRSVDTEP